MTFDDFEAIVKEFERADPFSSNFRYPVKSDLTASLAGHFTLSVRQFASTMDEVLATLSGGCDELPELANERARMDREALYEAILNDDDNGYEP